jgi:superoxide reductase
MAKTKFYKCDICGNFVGMLHSSGVPMICCGKPMGQVVAKDQDSGYEKHIPEVTQDGDVMKVQVGSVLHPMEEKHHIAWIYVETQNGGQRKECVGTPTAEFTFVNDEPVAVYEYCNLHGLWVKKLN